MPINYYANIDLNKNQLQNARIDNHANDTAAGTGVSGQLYYNTTNNELMIWTTAWEAVGSGANVTSVDTTNSTFINMTPTTASTGDVVVTSSLSATGTPDSTSFLRGDNTWATVVQEDTTYDLAGTGSTNGTAGIRLTGSDATTDDVLITGAGTTTVTRSGNTLTVTSNDQFDGTVTGVTAGTGISVAASATSPTVSVDYEGSDNIILSATAGTVVNADTIIFSDATDSEVKKGLVSDLPFAPDTVVTGVTSVNFNTDGDALDVASNSVTSSGTMTAAWQGSSSQYVNGEGNLTTFPSIPQGDITEVVAGDFLTGGGTTGSVTIDADATTAATADKLIARDASGYGFVVTPASGDSSTKIATTAFVQNALTGLLEFKGGFNASTGAIDGGGNLTSGGTRVAVEVGDYYVVTGAGDFFGNSATPLTVGDSVIVQSAAAVGASVEADFIVVQSDTDLATISTVGLGNVNAGTGVGVVYSSGTATVTNSDRGSSQNIFKNVASDSGTAVADSNDDTLTIAGGTNVTTAVVGDTLTITATNTNTQRDAGVGLTLNGNDLDVNVNATTQTVAANSVSATASRSYAVQVDASDDLVVNVPWTNTNTTYTAGTGMTLSGTTFNANVDGVQSTAANASTTTASRTYKVQVDGSDNLVVNVPWVDTDTQDVTSVAAAAGTTSTGSAITVTPTTGDVEVKSNAYDGGSNVGHVPAGGAAGDYLEGDGSWSNPMDNFSGTVFVGNTAGTTSAISYPNNVSFTLSKPMIQLYDATTGETVYADVDRGSNSFTVTFGTAPPNVVHALITYIKPISI